MALTGWPAESEPPDCLLVVPLPGLPCPLPASLPVLGLPLPEVSPPDPDPDPEPGVPVPPDSVGDEPPSEELSAGGLLLDLWVGGVVCPLTVGISVSYAGTPDDSA